VLLTSSKVYKRVFRDHLPCQGEEDNFYRQALAVPDVVTARRNDAAGAPAGAGRRSATRPNVRGSGKLKTAHPATQQHLRLHPPEEDRL
jgi:hypothetical protein